MGRSLYVYTVYTNRYCNALFQNKNWNTCAREGEVRIQESAYSLQRRIDDNKGVLWEWRLYEGAF
jgi:hypothetical protein